MLALTPSEFEASIVVVLRDLGYRDVEHCGGPGDLAVDIRCRDGQGRLVVVQCKRYGPAVPVGSPEIQKFIGMMYAHHQADHGLFVTTSYFTGRALQLAEQHGIELIDGAGLGELIQ